MEKLWSNTRTDFVIKGNSPETIDMGQENSFIGKSWCTRDNGMRENLMAKGYSIVG